MMSHTLICFLSGSLHFGIKFYCSDEDESSRLLLFFSSVPTAADTFWRTVGWDRPTGILIMIMMSQTRICFFDWESSFSNKILLQ